MRMSREYAFELIDRLGFAIQKKLVERGIKDVHPGHELRELKRQLEYRDIRPTECVKRLHEIAECWKIVGEEWLTLLRHMAV